MLQQIQIITKNILQLIKTSKSIIIANKKWQLINYDS